MSIIALSTSKVRWLEKGARNCVVLAAKARPWIPMHHHQLQSGNGAVPKWEPHAQMGIYVGCSSSHASNVALILNPRTGHVSPQFHIVFDDNFTTVQYLCTGMVLLHWADLVRSSAIIQMYTEKQVGTW
jgi:hypothetical protein